MRPFKIAKKTKIYISLALVLVCNPVIATTADLSQITRLANQGDIISQTNLAEMYYEGKVVPQDYKKALEWTQKAANQGNARAQTALGYMYYEGKVVPQDYKKALEWYQKAANQGYARAQMDLGFMYEKGRGVRQDHQKAFEWYQKAANQGYARAQTALGYIYYCLLYTSPSPRDATLSRMPSSA